MTAPRITVRVQRVSDHSTWPLPRYETDDAAGMDLRAAMAEPIVLKPGEHGFVPTGLALEIPRGYEGQVRPRSGLAKRHGLTVLNAPGTIDADYRGEVAVLLINLGRNAVTLNPGERIAQLIIAPVARAALVETENLDETERGGGGFGHTGR